MSRKPTGASLATPRVPRKSRSPSALTCASRTVSPSAVATALSVTPAQATSASSSMSPEQACVPGPPVAGCSPASTSALPVSKRQVTPSPIRPSAFSVTTAASGLLAILVLERSLQGLEAWRRPSYAAVVASTPCGRSPPARTGCQDGGGRNRPDLLAGVRGTKRRSPSQMRACAARSRAVPAPSRLAAVGRRSGSTS